MVKIYWTITDLATLMKNMQDNKFDCIIAICGSRGIGKSSMAVKLALKFPQFKIKRDIAFSRQDVMEQLTNKQQGVIVADEVINVVHNREFFSPEQNKMIKMLNMYRDSCNIFIVCVPNFLDLDRQFRNLVKIRIDIHRRGTGFVHFPIKSQFTDDIWCIKQCQRIQELWLNNKRMKPRYSFLPTYRGIIRFSDLSPKRREIYERVKQQKRNVLVTENMDINREKTKTEKLYNHMIELLDKKELKKEYIESMSKIMGIKLSAFINGLNLTLKNNGREITIIQELKRQASEKRQEEKLIKQIEKQERKKERNLF